MKKFFLILLTVILVLPCFLMSGCNWNVNLLDMKPHSITISPMTNGTVTSDRQSAMTGDYVILTVTPNVGYDLVNNSVRYGAICQIGLIGLDGNIFHYGFFMPRDNVTMEAQFELERSYTISTGTYSNGTISADYTSAKQGTVVTLTVSPNQYYRLKSGSLKYRTTYSNNTPYFDETVYINETTYSFIMPKNNIQIYATFEIEPLEPQTVNDLTFTFDHDSYYTYNITGVTYVTIRAYFSVENISDNEITLVRNEYILKDITRNITIESCTSILKTDSSIDYTISAHESNDYIFFFNGISTSQFTATNYFGVFYTDGTLLAIFNCA